MAQSSNVELALVKRDLTGFLEDATNINQTAQGIGSNADSLVGVLKPTMIMMEAARLNPAARMGGGGQTNV